MAGSGKRLISAGIFISVVSFLSKALGIVREVTLAYFFGTSQLVDAFRIAMSAVFLPLHVFGGFALNDSLVPVFKTLWANNKRRLLWILVNQLSVALILLSLVLVLLEYSLTAAWIRLLAPGFDAERARMAVTLTRWMSLMIPFYVMANIFLIVLNSFYIFKVPSLRPLIQNLFLLGGIILTTRKGSIDPLGWAYPAAFIFIGFILLPQTARRWRFAWSHRMSRVRKVWAYYLASFVPLLVFVFIQRANYLVDRIISSYLETGSIAALDYARFIIETPMTTIGLGLVQVALPFFSDLAAWGEREKLLRNVKILVQFSLVVMVFFSIFLWGASGDVIKLLFGYGAFRESSVGVTSSVLRGFSIGLWGLFAAYFLQRVYNARRKNRRLLVYAVCSLAMNVVLNILFSRIWGVTGIAVATSTANILFFSLLVLGLDRGLAKSFFGLLGILLPGACILAYTLPFLSAGVDNIVIRLAASLTVSVVGLWIWMVIFPPSRGVLRGLVSEIRKRAGR
jgi:putative peptidoglycan lipid II flippase